MTVQDIFHEITFILTLFQMESSLISLRVSNKRCCDQIDDERHHSILSLSRKYSDYEMSIVGIFFPTICYILLIFFL